MSHRNLAGHVPPQSGSCCEMAAVLAPKATLEHTAHLLWRNGAAAVPYANHQAVGAKIQTYFDDRPCGRIAARVIEQLAESELEEFRIGRHRFGAALAGKPDFVIRGLAGAA